MSNERTLKFRLGLFVAGCLILLGGLVILFGGAPSLFERRDRYTFLFPDATGINPGTPIRRSGVKIGEVDSLELDPTTGQVRIHVKIDPRYPPRSKETAALSRSLLGGDASIDLIPRSEERKSPDLGDPIPVGSTLVGLPPPDARELFTQASDVLPTAQASLEQIRRSVQKLDELIPAFKDTLTEVRDLTRTAREIAPELRRTNDTIRDTVAAFKSVGPEVRATAEQARITLANFDRVARDVQELIQKDDSVLNTTLKSFRTTVDAIGQTFTPENQRQIANLLRQANDIASTLNQVTVTLNNVLQDASKTVQGVNKNLPEVELVIKDIQRFTKPLGDRAEEVTKNIESASRNLDAAFSEIRELARAIGRAEGTVQMLLTDSKLYHALTDTISSINKVLPRVDRILQDFETFADKLARHPELIGIGGAVRPSGGLKESPFAPLPNNPIPPPSYPTAYPPRPRLP